MSETRPEPPSGRWTRLGTIFLAVITVAGVALSGLIDSPAKGVALVVTALALAAVVARVLAIWGGRLDGPLIALVAMFLVPLGFLVALLIPDSNGKDTAVSDSRTAQLEKRISELEQEKAALEAQISSLPPTTTSPDNGATATTEKNATATTSQPSADSTDFNLTLRSGWGADLDIGRPVRPPEAEGSDIYHDGTITGRYNDLIAFSHKPSGEECRVAIRGDRGNSYYRFDEITEGTSFCLLTDKERIAVLQVTKLGHDAQTDSEYAAFRVTLLK
jgi:hypothetical protein